jgi:hypothetical protein
LSALLDALGWIGSSLDKPGAAVRGLLSGDASQIANLIPFSDTLGITDPEQRVSGRNLLQKMGLFGDDAGIGGDVAGFGAELLTDPLNFLGAGLARMMGKAGKTARATNATREVALAAGGMPEEIAKLTRVVDEAGKPLKTYHGTSAAFDAYDAAKLNPDSLYGKGIYTTANPEIASTYTSKGLPPPSLQIVPGKEKELLNTVREITGYVPNWMQGDMLASLAEDIVKGKKLELGGMPYGSVSDPMRSIASADPLRATALREKLASAIEEVSNSGNQNVRMQYIDARKPLNLDMPNSHSPELNKVVQHFLGENRLNPQWTAGDAILELLGSGNPDAVMKSLRESGIDAFQHMGGGRIGKGKVRHQVTIALDPSQIYAPYVAPAARRVPSQNPLLAAMAAYEAGVAPGRIQ